MAFDFVPKLSQRQCLLGRTSLALDDAEGIVVAVESGCLWLTMENDPRDVVLMPGMRFEIDRSGRTIIAAEEDSRFRLLARDACPEGVASSIARKVSTVFERWTSRRTSGFAPYY